MSVQFCNIGSIGEALLGKEGVVMGSYEGWRKGQPCLGTREEREGRRAVQSVQYPGIARWNGGFMAF